MRTEHFYRAVVFDVPKGPWRSTLIQAQRDVAAIGLGEFDKYGKFWLTVPADIEWRMEWVRVRRAA